jgi:hypothetical protein
MGDKPDTAARAQLRQIGQQIAQAEQRLEILLTLRDAIIFDARRRGLGSSEISRILGKPTPQRVSQICAERRDAIARVGY